MVDLVPRHNLLVGYPNATRVNSLLSQLCVERRWCMPPNGEERVRQAMLHGLDAVADSGGERLRA